MYFLEKMHFSARVKKNAFYRGPPALDMIKTIASGRTTFKMGKTYNNNSKKTLYGTP